MHKFQRTTTTYPSIRPFHPTYANATHILFQVCIGAKSEQSSKLAARKVWHDFLPFRLCWLRGFWSLTHQCFSQYARIIQKLGFPAKFKVTISSLYSFHLYLHSDQFHFVRLLLTSVLYQDFKIQNIVGSCDVKFPIRLEGLAYSHGAFSSVSLVILCFCENMCVFVSFHYSW